MDENKNNDNPTGIAIVFILIILLIIFILIFMPKFFVGSLVGIFILIVLKNIK